MLEHETGQTTRFRALRRRQHRSEIGNPEATEQRLSSLSSLLAKYCGRSVPRDRATTTGGRGPPRVTRCDRVTIQALYCLSR